MNTIPAIRETRRDRGRERRKGRIRLLVISLIVLLSLGFLGAEIVTAFHGEAALQPPSVPPADGTPAELIPGGEEPEKPKRFNVLILGVDERPGDIGRSDTMILVSIGEEGQPLMISIPRDTRVEIPGYGYDKINHAYVYGGPELSVQVVSHLLKVPVDGYVIIDLDVFERAVNALGGVPINVEQRMYYKDPEQDLVIDLQPGQQRLSGDKAMQYVRYRADGLGDLGRVERQQKFLKALAKEAMSPKNILRLPAVANEVFNSVESDMSLPELLKALTAAIKTYGNGINGTALPGRADYIDEISYYLPDQSALDGLISEALNN